MLNFELTDEQRLLEQSVREWANREVAPRIRDLAVNGSDLIGIGYRLGPAIGHALRKLLDEVVRTPSLNTKEQLLERAKKLPR